MTKPGLLLALALASCAHSTSLPLTASRTNGVRWLVIAPHPDDEALIAGGVLARAVEHHEPAAVIVMTNGDYDCVVDGMKRQSESLRGLAALGLNAEHVHFLGYPDGSLARLGRAPLPPVRRIIDGACTTGTTTYGTNTAPVPYTRENAVADVARLLRELAPEDVILTHPEDTHPDHATTYAIFRDALDRLPRAPRVHRAVVHNGDCWPMSADPKEPCPNVKADLTLPTRPLSGRLAGIMAGERLPVSESQGRAKIRAIAAHESQTRGTDESYLFSFARSDELFFPETYERVASHWEPRAVHRESTNARLTERPTSLALRAYRVEIDTRDARVYLDGALHRTWPLPHDLWNDEASCALTLAAELELSCRSSRIGISIARSSPFDTRAPMP